jgi:cell division protein FtsW (lipid II flippase)
MRQFVKKQSIKFGTALMLVLASLMTKAQDKIDIDKEEVASWLERNWMWVVAGVVLLILVAMLGRRRTTHRGGLRKTTTVVKDADGHTKSVTTTEEPL